MADTKKEYTSNLHPKGDLDTTVYPNVKSENIIDKDRKPIRQYDFFKHTHYKNL